MCGKTFNVVLAGEFLTGVAVTGSGQKCCRFWVREDVTERCKIVIVVERTAVYSVS